MAMTLLSLADVHASKLDTTSKVGYFYPVKIVEAKPQDQSRVFLRFDNGVTGTVDLSELVGHGVFQAWQQPGIFERVSVSSFGALEWPGDLDLCPDALYIQVTGESVDEVFPAVRSLPVHA